MRLTCAALLALLSMVVVACTTNQDDCSKNPLLDCFHSSGGSAAAAGAAGTAGIGGMGAGGMSSGGASSGGMAGGGGSSGGAPCAKPGVECPGCGLCDGEPCTSGSECASAFCVDGVCCDTACDGGCQACNGAGTAGECSPLDVGSMDMGGLDCSNKGGCGETLGYCRCDDGVANGDETGIDCGGSMCNKKCGDGAGCKSTSDCVSGYCADGVCCNESCTGTCERCDLKSALGLCAQEPVGTKDKCGSGDVCSTAGDCGEADGGSCEDNEDCASYLCKGSGQKKCVACMSGNDCGGSRVCIGGGCFSKRSKGESCQGDAMCDTGHCVDTVCCEEACEGLCMGCQVNYTGKSNGTCAPILAGYDPHGECPQPDPSKVGPAGSAYCSGASLMGKVSSCVAVP